ncbi:F-box/WD repeat-containing protein [Parachlamydia acanthamoebae]|uniref:F-box/WD repeat-containing protein n=1 Tax=Parachlamydia acanthamoebae TaxID=83552 RepID=UPI0001C17AF1|nr:F-box/WD40 repeat-containing protein [Parachlamydia acanthamoebae]EFB40460.1 hypothetical protein pah_c205o118 [Parachlamydia acanthamoebae str. Hall's coccus]
MEHLTLSAVNGCVFHESVPSYISEFPQELLLEIFKHLGAMQLIDLRLVCSAFKKIAEDNVCWRGIVLSQTVEAQLSSWKKIYYSRAFKDLIHIPASQSLPFCRTLTMNHVVQKIKLQADIFFSMSSEDICCSTSQGKLVRAIQPSSFQRFCGLEILRDGLATGVKSKYLDEIQVRDRDSMKVIHAYTSEIECLKGIEGDGTTFIAFGLSEGDSYMEMRDIRQDKLVRKLFMENILCRELHFKGNFIVVSNEIEQGAECPVWDLRSLSKPCAELYHEEIFEDERLIPDALYMKSFTMDRQQLIASYENGELVKWNLVNFEKEMIVNVLKTGEDSLEMSMGSLQLSGYTLAYHASSSGTVRFFDSDTLEPIQAFSVNDRENFSLDFREQTLAVANDDQIKIWDFHAKDVNG